MIVSDCCGESTSVYESKIYCAKCHKICYAFENNEQENDAMENDDIRVEDEIEMRRRLDDHKLYGDFPSIASEINQNRGGSGC